MHTKHQRRKEVGMVFQRSFFWQVPIALFQDFDHGKEIEDIVPLHWTLSPDDLLEWEAGELFYGVARVVSSDSSNPELMATCLSGESGEILEGGQAIPGMRCVFVKVS